MSINPFVALINKYSYDYLFKKKKTTMDVMYVWISFCFSNGTESMSFLVFIIIIEE